MSATGTHDQPSAAALSVGGWDVHVSRNRISKGEQSIRLEPRTMSVLVRLAEAPGEVVTRQRLEDAVWPGMVVGYDALSNAISKLRKAFGDDRSDPRIIETIPKVGYRLLAGAVPSPPAGTSPGTARLERKLAAVLYADAVAYSRLTGQDEDATHHHLQSCLDIIRTSIEQHAGRLVHVAGDAVLADFGTVSNALGCACAVQEELRAYNRPLPAERRLMFRIGVNIGEVIEDRDEIYGDGVNLAARLEGIAEPGGVCISESVRTAIGNLLPLSYELLGERSFKNIARPVRAYAVRPEGTPQAPEPTGSEGKPVIGVLPFDNMSGAFEDDYFADGITEDIITALSKNRWLSVVARNSTFAFKGQSVDVRRVGDELGAGYVVEGSVRRAGDRVRISAQLLDAATGSHVWAERYDRDLGDIFALQDEITGTIAARIEPELGTVERQRAQRKPTRNLGAWDCYHLGMSQVYAFTKKGNTEAQRLFRRAIELDDRFALAHARLGYCIVFEMVYYDGEPTQSALDEALRLVKRAVSLEEQEAFCHLAVARVRLARREYALALIACETALKLNPHSAVVYCAFANGLAYAGRLEDSLGALEEAVRLSPNDPWRQSFYQYGAIAHLLLGHFEAAVEWARNAISQPNCQYWAHAHLAAALGRLGRRDEARAALLELLQMKPDFSCSYARKHLFYLESDSQVEEYVEALRNAGVPE